MSSQPGRILGRYRLERRVGRGGMAEVWEASDSVLGRRVAVKIILPDLAPDERFHERFRSEARAVAALEHPHVLPIYDFGEDGGEPYLVMPFLEQGTLADRLRRGGIAGAHAIEWIRQLASALDAAHARDVLHRDVKPANVMLGAGDRALLADFGIAKSSQSGQLTATGVALGTPAYMAPELARGEPASPASDRYALGVLAYELVCGRPPFAGDNALAVLHQHLTTPVPAVSVARPDLPADLDPVFARVLAKEAADRPGSCAELAVEISRAFGPERAGAPLAAAAGDSGPTLASTRRAAEPPTRTLHLERRPDRGAAATAPAKRLGIAAAVAGAVVVIAVGWWSLGGGGDREPSAEAAVAAAGVPLAPAATAPPAPAPPEDDAEDGGMDAPDAVAAQPETAKETSTRASAAAPARDLEPNGEGVSAPVPLDAPPPAPAVDSRSLRAGAEARRPGPGHFTIPAAGAVAIFERISKAWRRGRFEPALFEELETRLAGISGTPEAGPGIDILADWIAGGRALVAGDRAGAVRSFEAFYRHDSLPEWATLLPARFVARRGGEPEDWQLAIFWGDPRGEARALVERALERSPQDRNLLLARAVVEHLDGRHEEAARRAEALEGELRAGAARVVLARFAGDQLLWSGEVERAVSWYKRLLAAPDRTEIAAVNRTLGEEGGPALFARACTLGFQPACEAGRPLAGPRARRARQQP